MDALLGTGREEKNPAPGKNRTHSRCATTVVLQLLCYNYCTTAAAQIILFHVRKSQKVEVPVETSFQNFKLFASLLMNNKTKNISMIKEPLLLLLMTMMIKIVEADKRLKLCFCPGCKNGLKSLPGVRHLVGKTKNPFQSL